MAHAVTSPPATSPQSMPRETRQARRLRQAAEPSAMTPEPDDVPASPPAVQVVPEGADGLILDANDERVQIFADLKDHTLAIRDGIFITEGPEPIRLLLRNKMDIEALTVLLKPSTYEALREDIAACPRRSEIKVYVMHHKIMGSLIGFKKCRGALASAVVPPHAADTGLDRLLEYLRDRETWRLLAVDRSTNTANLGSMIRSASAFGVHAVVISGDCCDPWYRQCVRVSMGHIFNLPIVRVADLGATLSILHREHGVQSYAAVIDEDAKLLKRVQRPAPGRWCCVLGSKCRVASACRRLFD